MAYHLSKVAIASLFIFAFNGCFKTVTYVEGGPDPRSKYVVGEIEVISAYQYSGKRYRIAAVTRAPDSNGHEIVFDRTRVRTFGEEPWSFDAKPGDWVMTDQAFLTLSSLFSTTAVSLKGIDNKHVVYRYRLLKTCDVKIKSDQKLEKRRSISLN